MLLVFVLVNGENVRGKTKKKGRLSRAFTVFLSFFFLVWLKYIMYVRVLWYKLVFLFVVINPNLELL